MENGAGSTNEDHKEHDRKILKGWGIKERLGMVGLRYYRKKLKIRWVDRLLHSLSEEGKSRPL